MSRPDGLTLAAVAVSPGRTECKELPLPGDLSKGALLRVEACGICGSDVTSYTRADRPPRILGHESVGTLAAVDPSAAARWGLDVGARVLVEEYLPCGVCSACRAGEHRFCAATDAASPQPLRYGTTGIHVAPGLWGGNSQYQYLHPASMLHELPTGMDPLVASFALPLANGIQFLQIEGKVEPGQLVLVIGPGQQGLGALIAAREAGAEVVLAGRFTDSLRLSMGSRLGAVGVMMVDLRDPIAEYFSITSHRLADIVVDLAAGSAETAALATELVRPGGTILLGASSVGSGGTLDIRRLWAKHIHARGVRGHSYRAVERALSVLSSNRYPVRELCTHRFGLHDVHNALTTAGHSSEFVHAVVEPWMTGGPIVNSMEGSR